MEEAIKYISKIEIKGLWGRYDLEWNLHPDVNVLSGVNGSGKSTILRYLYEVIDDLKMPNESLFYKIKKIIIIFNTGEILTHDCEIQNHNESATESTNGSYYVLSKKYEKKSDNLTATCKKVMSFPLNEKLKSVLFFLIKTEDNDLITREIAQKFDDNIRTYLDWLIYLLQRSYLNYQINIGKRALQLNGSGTDEERSEIDYPKRRFIEILNKLFAQTDKKVNETENEIEFYVGDEPISAYDLSSGEKQMLIVLLSALVQDNKPTIMFLDEPTTAMHYDWQKKLIGYIRELNPNVQIILATQSSPVIIEGWVDKVSEMSQLITSDNQAVLQDAA